MALFTQDQVRAVTLLECKQYIVDAVFNSWIISVQDEDGFKYYWKDETTSGDATAEEMADAIGDYLMGIEKKVVAVKTEPHPELDAVKTNLASYTQGA